MLNCDEAVAEVRVRAGDRVLRRKWTDPDGVAQFRRRERLLRPVDDLAEIDTGRLAADAVAEMILGQVGVGPAT